MQNSSSVLYRKGDLGPGMSPSDMTREGRAKTMRVSGDDEDAEGKDDSAAEEEREGEHTRALKSAGAKSKGRRAAYKDILCGGK